MTARLVDALDDRGIRDAHVMGYSHGGVVAQQLARTAPATVRSLALVATYAHNTATPRERLEGWLMPHLVRLLGMRRLAALVARPGTGGGPPLPPDRIAWMRGMLAELHIPTIVISGGDDTAVPARHAAMLATGIPGARTAVIADAGHTMVWTHPDRLRRDTRRVVDA